MTRPFQPYRAPKPPRPGRPPRPVSRPTALPAGQNIIKRMRNINDQRGGIPFMEPPPGFVSATTSAEEWGGLYHPLAIIFNDPPDPRKPPYWGGTTGVWEYQSMQLGGRSRPGGAVVDAVVYTATGPIGLRLVTEYWHYGKGSRVQANDAQQILNLQRSGYMQMVDIFSQDVIEDASGATAIQVIKDAIGGIQRPDPLQAGVVRRTSIGRVIG